MKLLTTICQSSLVLIDYHAESGDINNRSDSSDSCDNSNSSESSESSDSIDISDNKDQKVDDLFKS